MIQVIKLKEGTVLISQLEVASQVEYGAPNIWLINPYIPQKDRRFLKERWLSEYTDTSVFLIDDADILTLADPTEELLNEYKKVNNVLDKDRYEEVIEEDEEVHY